MKKLILLIFPLLLFSYTSSYGSAMTDIKREMFNKGVQEFRKNKNEKKRKLAEKKLKQIEAYNKKVKAEKAEKKQKLIDANADARRQNEEYYKKNQNTSSADSNQDSQQHTYVKHTYNPSDFKDQAQIKLDDLHILGVESVKIFKGDKYIIKAINGTFAIPKDKFDKAEKINFTQKLMN